ncbi:MAG: rod shape-determining protein MreD [Selenomonadaceae bacterium]|nr:rod shape-determining protein MreD [Selenomonadaceae bacterium]
MKKIGIWAAFAAGLYVFQSSLFPLLAYHGISVNLLLLLTVSFAFLHGCRFGVLMGFCAGLLQDLGTGTFLGCSVLSYMVIGWVCGKLSDRVFKEEFFLPIMASVFATAGNYFILVTLMLLLGYRFHLATNMQDVLLPMFVYQLVFAYPVHKAVYELDQRLGENK